MMLSSCLFPRASNPSLVSRDAVLVPAFLGLEMKAATKGTPNFSDKAIAYSLAGFSLFDGSTGSNILSNITIYRQRNVYLTLPSRLRLSLRSKEKHWQKLHELKLKISGRVRYGTVCTHHQCSITQ